MKKLILIFSALTIFLVYAVNSGFLKLAALDKYLPKNERNGGVQNTSEKVLVETEESVITRVVEESLPSVVTIAISKTESSLDFFEYNPFDPFSPFRLQPGKEEVVEENIGSGFIVSQDGLIITNKHVVADTEAEYKVITNDNKTYKAERIFRDPVNDLALVKINAQNLRPLPLGDSSNLKLGQLAIAIGTPLGEFKNTVTTGIISGLGRGITAGSPFEGFVERLDNVIQTDAAINPGNSGGPLLNSAGKVIGVNTAVSQQGQNIGFAIPVNVVKELLDNYRSSGGKISRPFLGVRYQMIDEKTAVINKLPVGAYVLEVIEGSGAQDGGIVEGDVILKIDGIELNENTELSKIIRNKKPGDTLELEVWRDGEKLKKRVVLGEFE